MKRFAPFVLLFAVLAVGPPAGGQDDPPVVDLILVAGQSNAVGYDAKPAELPADPGDKAILYWWRCGDPPPDDHDSTSGSKWTHLQPVPRGRPGNGSKPRQYGNFAQAEGGFGPEMGLARALRTKQGHRLAVVKVAFSGTSLLTDWDPTDPGDAGACYRALVKETRAAVAAAKAGPKVRLRPRALAWVQGESDADAGRAPRYAKALAAMIAALRHDLNAPDLRVLLAVNTRFGEGKNPFVARVVEAQKAVSAADPKCAYVDSATAAIANGAHFSSAGTLDVGQRMAAALLKLEARPPGQ